MKLLSSLTSLWLLADRGSGQEWPRVRGEFMLYDIENDVEIVDLARFRTYNLHNLDFGNTSQLTVLYKPPIGTNTRSIKFRQVRRNDENVIDDLKRVCARDGPPFYSSSEDGIPVPMDVVLGRQTKVKARLSSSDRCQGFFAFDAVIFTLVNLTTAAPTTATPTTTAPTTTAPTTAAPTTTAPTTAAPTTAAPTTTAPTTAAPTTAAPTTAAPTTAAPTNPRSLCYERDTGVTDPSRFNMCIGLANIPSNSSFAEEILLSAAHKWSDVIVGDVPDFVDNITFVGCNDIPAVVDDHFACVETRALDGDGGSVAVVRTYFTDHHGQPKASLITFDEDDVLRLESSPVQLENLVTRTLGIALGFMRSTLQNAEIADYSCNYFGANATALWQNMNSTCGSPPMRRVGQYALHFEGEDLCLWDECLGNEVMTRGNLADSPAFISDLTLAVFEDVGYEVNYAAAEPLNPSVNCSCEMNPSPPFRRKAAEANARAQGKAFLENAFESTLVNQQALHVLYEDEEGKLGTVQVSE